MTLTYPYGAAIYSENSHINQETVTISNCTADYGGTIYLTETSSLETANEQISNCSANEGGGAIYSTKSSSISLSDISIDSCKAKNGGAIYIDGSIRFNIQKASIINSTTKNCNSDIDVGTIVECGNSCLSLNDSKIINCKLKNKNIGKGNAIYKHCNAKLKINKKSTISFYADKCQLNADKDDGKQKYKLDGIFDEKLDKNNPKPFEITSSN